MSKHVIKQTIITGEIVGEISVGRACTLLRVERELFEALVEEGVFEVAEPTAPLRRDELRLLRTAARLFNDLGVNPAGIAIILELLDRETST